MNLLIVLRLGIKTNLLKKIICWGRDEHWEHHPLVCWVCDYSAVAGKIQSGTVDSAGDIQSGYCQLYWGYTVWILSTLLGNLLCRGEALSTAWGWGFMTWHPVPVTCNQKIHVCPGELLGLNSSSGIKHIQRNFDCFPTQVICKSHHYIQMQYVSSRIQTSFANKLINEK
jgi:hypothetical protein